MKFFRTQECDLVNNTDIESIKESILAEFEDDTKMQQSNISMDLDYLNLQLFSVRPKDADDDDVFEPIQSDKMAVDEYDKWLEDQIKHSSSRTSLADSTIQDNLQKVNSQSITLETNTQSINISSNIKSISNLQGDSTVHDIDVASNEQINDSNSIIDNDKYLLVNDRFASQDNAKDEQTASTSRNDQQTQILASTPRGGKNMSLYFSSFFDISNHIDPVNSNFFLFTDCGKNDLESNKTRCVYNLYFNVTEMSIFDFFNRHSTAIESIKSSNYIILMRQKYIYYKNICAMFNSNQIISSTLGEDFKISKTCPNCQINFEDNNLIDLPSILKHLILCQKLYIINDQKNRYNVFMKKYTLVTLELNNFKESLKLKIAHDLMLVDRYFLSTGVKDLVKDFLKNNLDIIKYNCIYCHIFYYFKDYEVDKIPSSHLNMQTWHSIIDVLRNNEYFRESNISSFLENHVTQVPINRVEIFDMNIDRCLVTLCSFLNAKLYDYEYKLQIDKSFNLFMCKNVISNNCNLNNDVRSFLNNYNSTDSGIGLTDVENIKKNYSQFKDEHMKLYGRTNFTMSTFKIFNLKVFFAHNFINDSISETFFEGFINLGGIDGVDYAFLPYTSLNFNDMNSQYYDRIYDIFSDKEVNFSNLTTILLHYQKINPGNILRIYRQCILLISNSFESNFNLFLNKYNDSSVTCVEINTSDELLDTIEECSMYMVNTNSAKVNLIKFEHSDIDLHFDHLKFFDYSRYLYSKIKRHRNQKDAIRRIKSGGRRIDKITKNFINKYGLSRPQSKSMKRIYSTSIDYDQYVRDSLRLYLTLYFKNNGAFYLSKPLPQHFKYFKHIFKYKYSNNTKTILSFEESVFKDLLSSNSLYEQEHKNLQLNGESLKTPEVIAAMQPDEFFKSMDSTMTRVHMMPYTQDIYNINLKNVPFNISADSIINDFDYSLLNLNCSCTNVIKCDNDLKNIISAYCLDNNYLFNFIEQEYLSMNVKKKRSILPFSDVDISRIQSHYLVFHLAKYKYGARKMRPDNIPLKFSSVVSLIKNRYGEYVNADDETVYSNLV